MDPQGSLFQGPSRNWDMNLHTIQYMALTPHAHDSVPHHGRRSFCMYTQAVPHDLPVGSSSNQASALWSYATYPRFWYQSWLVIYEPRSIQFSGARARAGIEAGGM